MCSVSKEGALLAVSTFEKCTHLQNRLAHMHTRSNVATSQVQIELAQPARWVEETLRWSVQNPHSGDPV